MSLSPDARWISYVSSESGLAEVYVRPFPNVDSAQYIISAGGGLEPLWSRDGRELFYRNLRGKMFAMPISPGGRFTSATAVPLFDTPGLAMQGFLSQ